MLPVTLLVEEPDTSIVWNPDAVQALISESKGTPRMLFTMLPLFWWTVTGKAQSRVGRTWSWATADPQGQNQVRKKPAFLQAAELAFVTAAEPSLSWAISRGSHTWSHLQGGKNTQRNCLKGWLAFGCGRLRMEPVTQRDMFLRVRGEARPGRSWKLRVSVLVLKTERENVFWRDFKIWILILK